MLSFDYLNIFYHLEKNKLSPYDFIMIEVRQT